MAFSHSRPPFGNGNTPPDGANVTPPSFSSSSSPIEALAEKQYATAKTSVWWDIEKCCVPRSCDSHTIAKNISFALARINYCGPVSVSAYGDTNRIPTATQHALSSTGVSLNHVPAGVKDASDKKILVDMLFWAIDNPPPANYLLISGDSDFSNALHHLRMRRYNILLAQPHRASVPLIAAAKTIWLWTSLVGGGLPLYDRESSQLITPNHAFNHETLQNLCPRTAQRSQVHICNQNPALECQVPFDFQKVGDIRSRTKHDPRSMKQVSMDDGSTTLTHDYNNSNDQQIARDAQEKQFKKAPHEFFSNNGPAPSSSSLCPSLIVGNSSSPMTKGSTSISLSLTSYSPDTTHFLQPSFNSNGFFSPKSHDKVFPMAPACNRPINYNGTTVHTPPNRSRVEELPDPSNPSRGEEYIPAPVEILRSAGFERQSSSPVNPISTSGGYLTNHFAKLHPYIQEIIGVILFALDTLKTEQVMPIESNIIDFICCIDLYYNIIDIKKALCSAVQCNTVARKSLHEVHFYVRNNDGLWKCVNPLGGSVDQYPNATWQALRAFLTSDSGRSAIVASRSKYEAAFIMRRGCLEKLVLGEVLQILEVICETMKWIMHHPSGWQPVSINVTWVGESMPFNTNT